MAALTPPKSSLSDSAKKHIEDLLTEEELYTHIFSAIYNFNTYSTSNLSDNIPFFLSEKLGLIDPNSL
jgi:hypothetical protein